MKTYFIKTFGCQMNVSDSERIAGFLERRGLKKASKINESDLVVFNTCGVRQMAEDRMYGQVHNLAVISEQKSENRIIIVTGCLANRKDVRRRLKDKVDLFVSIKDFQKEVGNYLFRHPELPQRRIPNKEMRASYNPTGILRSAQNDYLDITPKHTSPFTAYVPIMTGCNNFCAYCIVPYARGREVSRPANEIIKEVKSLVQRGYKEIFLLGQNVNSYLSPLPLTPSPSGKSLPAGRQGEGVNFFKLLQKINAVPGKFWIHFMSNHPKDFSDELIETATTLPKVCECIHLPIQAGDDEILKKMNRKYTAQKYLQIVKKIKTAFEKNKPGKLYALTSDIIVGFPSETRKQFLQSAEVMKKANYDLVYFGQFSPRPETAAWKMKDNVGRKEKARREKYLNEILKKTALENNKKYLGKIVEVLIYVCKEAKLPIGSLASKLIYLGKTRTMKNVKIHLTPPSPQTRRGGRREVNNLVGKFVKVKIIKANIWNLEACLPKRQGEIK